MNRRSFLRVLGLGTVAAGASLAGGLCRPEKTPRGGPGSADFSPATPGWGYEIVPISRADEPVRPNRMVWYDEDPPSEPLTATKIRGAARLMEKHAACETFGELYTAGVERTILDAFLRAKSRGVF